MDNPNIALHFEEASDFYGHLCVTNNSGITIKAIHFRLAFSYMGKMNKLEEETLADIIPGSSRKLLVITQPSRPGILRCFGEFASGKKFEIYPSSDAPAPKGTTLQ